MKFCLILFQYLLLSAFPFSLVFSSPPPPDNTQPSPALLLANIYQPGITLEDYWLSEKLDGVRAFWNGKNFISRQGNIFHAPEWFLSPLPKLALDGELWMGRGKFERLSGMVRRQSPDDSGWKNIKFMVFDLPDNAQTFDRRLKQLKKIVRDINAPHIQAVDQTKVSTHEALMKKLDDIIQQGGEGLMLHAGSSFYKKGRSDGLLKVKKHFDAEAIVIKHLPGKGKYTGILGSIIVETANGKRFKIGSGFSDNERKNPPAIGSTITYKYFGLTNKGTPRFASFLRHRNSH
ncbi:MAG: DNA ligase [Gammaproteobacteria bacterium]|nr:DNA ligase [Gammaproteobacteria bacterium]MCF6261050.1 DNA ligase [Gammaproteobacteria bacterium]